MTRTEQQELLNKLDTEKMTLQSQLNDSDYKVIKCAEAQVLGGELPYDMSTLHQERQLWRDRINSIEEQKEELLSAEVTEETITEQEKE